MRCRLLTDRCVLVPRPRCGRSLLPYRTEWDLRSRTTPAQRPRRVISISRPSRPSHRQPVQDAPAGRHVSSCSCSCPQPTDRHPALDQLPCRPGGERDAAAAADPYRRPVCRRPCRSQAQPNPRPSLPRQTPIRGSDDPATRRPPRHIAPDAPGRGRPRRTDACQDPALCGQRGRRGHGHRRRVRPDTRIAPVAWTPVAWTPDVRPTQWTDVRPADSGRGQATNGVSGVRTSSTATATGGWAGPTPLGLPRRRRSAIHDGSAVTTPAAAAVTAAARAAAQHRSA
jgi:hypothetical protein